MNVGIYIPSITPDAGGGYTYQDSLIQSLIASKPHDEFIIFYYGPKRESGNSKITFVSLEPASRFVFYKLLWLVKNFYFLFFQKHFISKYNPLYKAVREYGIDIMWYVTTSYEYVDIPYIYTIWDLQHRLQPYFPEVSVLGWTWDVREHYYRSILPRASYVITGNQAGKREIMQFYGIDSDRIRLLPHPTPNFSLEKITGNVFPSLHLPKKYLFYPAQFWSHKNHIVLLDALAILVYTYHQNISFVFTGSDKGNLRYIKDKIVEYQLQDYIIFLDFVPTEELKALYTHAVALVYPTFFGPENLPPLEAFALGCPVIASNVSGAEEQLGDAAILVPPTDSLQIADAVMGILKNSKKRRQLIRKGKIRAKRWTSDHYVKKMFALLDEFKEIRRRWR